MSSSDELSPPPPTGPPPSHSSRGARGGALAGAPSPPNTTNDDAIARLDLGFTSLGGSRTLRQGGLGNSPNNVDRSTSPARNSPGRPAPSPPNDAVGVSNIRRAASTLTNTTMRLHDPQGNAIASEQALAARDQRARAAAGEDHSSPPTDSVVQTIEGEYEIITTQKRFDGVEVISRGIQTDYSKRHTRLGIVFRGHPMSKLVIFILFVAPLLVILSIISLYVNWRPQFQIWNAKANGNVQGEDPPGWLYFLVGANFFQLFMTYLVLIPTAYECLTTDEESTARRDVLVTALLFALSFLPVWVGEFAISDQFPTDKSHAGSWASYLVLWGGGAVWYGCVWFVYSTYMADLMHAKARRAADDYLRAIQFGVIYSPQKREQMKRQEKLQRNYDKLQKKQLHKMQKAYDHEQKKRLALQQAQQAQQEATAEAEAGGVVGDMSTLGAPQPQAAFAPAVVGGGMHSNAGSRQMSRVPSMQRM